MSRCILLGYGEIGKAVKEFFGEYHEIEVNDIKFHNNPTGKFDILLVAIPYALDFVDTVISWALEYSVRAVIIFSTVAVGTTRKIPNAVHSPVEGKHPSLAKSIEIMPRWVGGHQNMYVREFFRHIETKYVKRPEITEAVKLLSTSLYGVNIEFARYAKEVLGEGYKYFTEFNMDYNSLYIQLGIPQYQRYILYPPKGNISGHCVTPNARILDEQYPSPLLKEIYLDKEEIS